MLHSLKYFLGDRSGSNALEYGLIVALVSLAVVAGAAVAGTDLGALFTAIGDKLTSITAGI
ncbi:MAG TPA: Flp family type IVb pilin [Stellaceae bacterium]|nr:Flp family type IVb pilin [Stellaceae bacterium]